MKIGFLADELAPGSAPVIIGYTIRGLRRLGYDAECILIVRKPYPERYPEIFKHYLRGDVPIQYVMDRLLGVFTKYNFKFPGFSFFSFHHISSGLFSPFIFKPKEWDIIIANCQYTSFIARPLSIFRKIPYLQLIWDPAPYTFRKIYLKRKMKFLSPVIYPLTFLLDRFAYGGCKAIITSGKLHHEYLSKVTRKNLEILYPGCNPLERLPDFRSRQKMILTYDRWDIGNIPNKFLEILNSLDDPEIKLAIGGFWHPSTLKESFVQEVKSRNLTERVELLGPLSENMIRDLCSKAMVHIHHNEEAFGMQSLEAAACGCPVIIPRGSGVTDLFQHGVHGYFPEKNNLTEFIKYTQLIFSDVKQTEEMGRRAWEAAKNYTWQHYVRQLVKIIEKYFN